MERGREKKCRRIESSRQPWVGQNSGYFYGIPFFFFCLPVCLHCTELEFVHSERGGGEGGTFLSFSPEPFTIILMHFPSKKNHLHLGFFYSSSCSNRTIHESLQKKELKGVLASVYYLLQRGCFYLSSFLPH